MRRRDVHNGAGRLGNLRGCTASRRYSPSAGVALSRKGAKSRTGGRKRVMLMARPIPCQI